MKKFLLILALLTAPSQANTLRLEFAQEGEPRQPRALIVIHNVFEDRTALKGFFTAWANGSWGRDQYCSVYSYEYDGNGLTDLVSSEKLGADLFAKIRGDDFQKGDADDINPARRVAPTDGRQPAPSLDGENIELIFAGVGHGGLVARQAALLAKKRSLKVTRVACIGTPLDGMSTVDLLLAMGLPERAKLLGLSNPLKTLQALESLSTAWWELTAMFDKSADWATQFAPAYVDVKMIAGYGSASPPDDPTDNVLYGRNRPVVHGFAATSDGFVAQPLGWGKKTGPITWTAEATLAKTSHADLTEGSADLILKQVVDRKVIFGYLGARQVIEEYIKGDGEMPPLYQYWDEREEGAQPQPIMRDAYATAKARYEMLWGVY